jgi:hypothetical protein
MSTINPTRFVVRESRRARNAEEGGGPTAHLACECTRASCDLTVPVLAAAHRGPGEFIVAPLHVDGDTPIMLDDRFLIVRIRMPDLAASLILTGSSE